MATGKVARRAAVEEIEALLDSPEVAELITELNAFTWTGRKGYGGRVLVGACLVKTLYNITTWTRTHALISDHQGLQEALGGCPSLWACYRFTTKLRKHSVVLAECLDRVICSLQATLPGLGGDIAIDGSNMPAYANGMERIYQDGPLRDRYSDPDATWGHRSAVSTRGAGAYYGYKLHLAVCTQTGLPLAWEVATAKAHDSLFATPLIDKIRERGITPQTAAMDKGYDAVRVHTDCNARGIDPVIPLKGEKDTLIWPETDTPTRHNPRIGRHTELYKKLYRGRSAVEREFGRLKHDYALELRVRGLERVRLHADLVMLGRLTQQLVRARTA